MKVFRYLIFAALSVYFIETTLHPSFAGWVIVALIAIILGGFSLLASIFE